MPKNICPKICSFKLCRAYIFKLLMTFKFSINFGIGLPGGCIRWARLLVPVLSRCRGPGTQPAAASLRARLTQSDFGPGPDSRPCKARASSWNAVPRTVTSRTVRESCGVYPLYRMSLRTDPNHKKYSVLSVSTLNWTVDTHYWLKRFFYKESYLKI